MNLTDYPAQEPLSPVGERYQTRVLELGKGVQGTEHAYGPDPYQSLAVFPAKDPSGDVLVFFHGGGWTSGYKEWMYFMAPALTGRGVTFVSAGYRLAPAHVFPAGFDDCAAAVAWVAEHIGSQGGNPQRIFVGGHSAGGHYSALLSVTSAWRRRHRLAHEVLRGCLPVSGVYRFGEGSGLTTRPRFLGPNTDPQVDVATSPLLSLEADAAVPFLLTHGSNDFPHLVAQAAEMTAALGAAGVPAETEVLQGCDHFQASIACGDLDGPWVARAVRWMRQVGH